MSSFQELAAEEVRTTFSHEDVVDKLFSQAKIEKRLKDEYMVQFMGGMDVPSILYQRVLKGGEQVSQAWQFHVMPHTACIVKNASDIEELRTTQTGLEEQIDSVQHRFESCFEVTQETWENDLRSTQYQIDTQSATHKRYREELASTHEDISDEMALMWCQINTMKEENKELKRELEVLGKKKPVITYCGALINVVMIVLLMALMIPPAIITMSEYLELP
jgi:hypothetical protein